MKLFSSTVWQTTSTLIHGETELYLFDPAYLPQEISRIQQSIGNVGDKTKYLIFTHGDWDHIAGFSSFETWETIGHHQLKVKNDLDKNAECEKIVHFDADWYIERIDEPRYPRIDIPITKETNMKTSDDLLCFLPILGHTNDGIATFFIERSIVVAGDMLSNLEFPFIYHSTEEYINSLELMKQKIETYQIRMLISGHGRPATTKTEILDRISYDLEYLQELNEKVRRHLAKGIHGEALVKSLNNFLYKNSSIPSYLKPRHVDNIVKIEQEYKQSITN